MYDEVVGLLVSEGIEFIYTAEKFLIELERKYTKFSSLHFEVTTNEKIAYEMAFATSIVKKSAAFVTTNRSVFESLDPMMSSVYMGVLGGMLIISVRDTEHDLSFLGPFAKIPIIVEGNVKNYRDAISFGMSISKKYEIPVLVELDVTSLPQNINHGIQCEIKQDEKGTRACAEFVKDTTRWAATPNFRYTLHVLLNEKIEKIREEFETYPRNITRINGNTGFITYREAALDLLKDDFSTLFLSTVYPLPKKLVSEFIKEMEEVFILSDPHSVLRFQLQNSREKIKSSLAEKSSFNGAFKKEERIHGYELVRDILGPASSMNMAHGIKKLSPEKNILAVTYEDHFFHSGIPAFINALYNGSDYHLLILCSKRESELVHFMENLDFHNYYFINELSEIERYSDNKRLTVFLKKGGI
ncbi:MAG: hypothetical protein N2513_04690 [Deltaproteobacteria bacterium]|nr:hypothetical protein [Deltaproteobacteria bacterium]